MNDDLAQRRLCTPPTGEVLGPLGASLGNATTANNPCGVVLAPLGHYRAQQQVFLVSVYHSACLGLPRRVVSATLPIQDCIPIEWAANAERTHMVETSYEGELSQMCPFSSRVGMRYTRSRTL